MHLYHCWPGPDWLHSVGSVALGCVVTLHKYSIVVKHLAGLAASECYDVSDEVL
jgi:hypothetical protein